MQWLVYKVPIAQFENDYWKEIDKNQENWDLRNAKIHVNYLKNYVIKCNEVISEVKIHTITGELAYDNWGHVSKVVYLERKRCKYCHEFSNKCHAITKEMNQKNNSIIYICGIIGLLKNQKNKKWNS